MRTFAVIENGLVVNIIVGVENKVVAANSDKFVEYTEESPTGIGWSYDGSVFTAPVVEPSDPIKV